MDVIVVGVVVSDGGKQVVVGVHAHALHHVLSNGSPLLTAHGFAGWQS